MRISLTSRRRRLLAVAVVVFALALIATLGVGDLLSEPSPRLVGAAPTDLAAEVVKIPYAQNAWVAGWFVRGQPGAGSVLLLHGVHDDRRSMLHRARTLHAQGYTTLLIDLPAHGESSGDRISFGYLEAAGVNAALGYLRQRTPGNRIGVIGFSLGAASLVLAHPHPEPDAVVLESMFPTITDAIRNRIAARLGPLSVPLTPLLEWQIPLRLHFSSNLLRPIDALPSLHSNILIAGGSLDPFTPPRETEQVFQVAPQPKSLWLVRGAGHQDLYDYAPREYEARVLPFLQEHLQAAPPTLMAQAFAP